jgi:hypothetical protein
MRRMQSKQGPSKVIAWAQYQCQEDQFYR